MQKFFMVTAAVVMGFFSGSLIFLLVLIVYPMRWLMVFAENESVMLIVSIASLIMFLAAWGVSTWRIMRNAASVTRIISRGFLLGAAEWLLLIPATALMGTSAIGAEPAVMSGSDFLAVGFVTMMTGGVAVGMAVFCLIGFLVFHFLGREMKPETAATVPCPDCAELIRPAARKCRFCGSVFGEQSDLQ